MEESSDQTGERSLSACICELDEDAAQLEVQGYVRKAISEVMGTKPDYDLDILFFPFVFSFFFFFS
jgi:hypothetical protein